MELPSRPSVRRPAGRHGHNQRRGTATVEFAIVVPVLMLLLLGMIEYAQVTNVSQLVSSASRRGARMAARDSTLNVTAVENYVANFITSNFPNSPAVQVHVTNDAGVRLTGSELGSIPSGTPLAVDVSFNFDTVRWLRHFVTLDSKVLQTITTARRE